MSHKQIKVTPAAAKVEISPAKCQRWRIESSRRGRFVALLSDNFELDSDIEHSDDSPNVSDSADEAPSQRSSARNEQAKLGLISGNRCVWLMCVPGIECQCNLPATVMCRQCD